MVLPTTRDSLTSPCATRFDLIFVLRDTRNEGWDRVVSGFVLENKIPSEELSKVEKRGNKPAATSPVWSFEELHAYISFCKGLQPHLSEDATAVLATYYKRQGTCYFCKMYVETLNDHDFGWCSIKSSLF